MKKKLAAAAVVAAVVMIPATTLPAQAVNINRFFKISGGPCLTFAGKPDGGGDHLTKCAGDDYGYNMHTDGPSVLVRPGKCVKHYGGSGGYNTYTPVNTRGVRIWMKFPSPKFKNKAVELSASSCP